MSSTESLVKKLDNKATGCLFRNGAFNFLSMLLFLILSMQSEAMLCKDAHSPTPWINTLNLDAEASRRGYRAYAAGDEYLVPEFMSTVIMGKTVQVPTSAHIRKFYTRTKMLNIASMGILGDLFDLTANPLTGKIEAKELEWRKKEITKQTLHDLQSISTIPKHIEDLIHEGVQVQEIDQDKVLVSAKFVSTKSSQGIEQAILHRFEQVGTSVVTYVYRKSGLESNNALTGFIMRDEIIEIMNQNRGFSFHMMYDKKIWELEKKMIAAHVREFENATDEKEKTNALYKINQARDPFLPSSGIVTTEHPYFKDKPVELKRYFQNDLEDPLNFAHLGQRSSNKDRQKMLFKVISDLPAGTGLEIHAHSEVHRIAYQKLGFQVQEVTESPLYPGVKIYIMRANREQFLGKTTN